MTSNQIAYSANTIQESHNRNSEANESERNRINAEQASETARHNSALESLESQRNDLTKMQLEITENFNRDKLALDERLAELNRQYQYAALEQQRQIQEEVNAINAEKNRITEQYNRDQIMMEQLNADIKASQVENDLLLGLRQADWHDQSLVVQERIENNKLEWQKAYDLRRLEQSQAQIDIDREKLNETVRYNTALIDVQQTNASTNAYNATTQRLTLDFEKEKWKEERWNRATNSAGSLFSGIGRLLTALAM